MKVSLEHRGYLYVGGEGTIVPGRHSHIPCSQGIEMSDMT